jgi:hypothetical protein
MIVTWTVEGVDWSQEVRASIDSEPSEIATRAVETIVSALGDSDEIEFGAILMIQHDKMKSEDEYRVVYAPAILANAGYYQDAEELKLAADKEFL